jgi:hypothetical protein
MIARGLRLCRQPVLQRGQLGARRGNFGLELPQRELVNEASVKAQRLELVRARSQLKGALRRGDLRVEREHREVRAHHVRCERDAHGLARRLGREKIGARRLGCAGEPAPQIHFVCDVELRPVVVALERCSQREAGCRALRGALAVTHKRRIDGRRQRRIGDL